jgi:amino acid transporter
MQLIIGIILAYNVFITNGLRFPSRSSILSSQTYYSTHYKVQTHISASRTLYSDLSLDHSVVPRFMLTKNTKVFIAAAVVLVGILIASLGGDDYDDDDYDDAKTITPPATKTSHSFIVEFLNAAQLLVNIFVAKFFLGLEKIRQTFGTLFNINEGEKIDLKEWNICEFDSRSKLIGPYVKYRFKLPDPYEDSTLPLYVGQEVINACILHIVFTIHTRYDVVAYSMLDRLCLRE